MQRNAQEGTDRWPCIVVRHPDGRTEYTNHVRGGGPFEVRYHDPPLHDGARVWVETDAPAEAVG